MTLPEGRSSSLPPVGHVQDSKISLQSVRQSHIFIVRTNERTCVALEDGREEDKTHFLIWRGGSKASFSLQEILSVVTITARRDILKAFVYVRTEELIP